MPVPNEVQQWLDVQAKPDAEVRQMPGMTVSPSPMAGPHVSPNKVLPESTPGGGVVQIPDQSNPAMDKKSAVEGVLGKYHDRIKLPQYTGRHFQEEQTRLTKI